MDLLPLSAIDHAFTTNMSGPIQLVFHYRAKLDARRLVEAFWGAARQFVGVTGVLDRIDECTLGFDLSRDAAEIRVTSDGPDTPVRTCVDPAWTKLGAPLARARIADLGSNGTAVGFSMSHAVADGYGFFFFLAAWAARVRGGQFPEPRCDRSILTQPSARVSRGGEWTSRSLEQSGFVLLDAETEIPEFQLEERRLPAGILERPKGEPGERSFSPSDLLSATLWKDLLDDLPAERVTLACPVDLRRHRDDLGPLFFGNAAVHASLTVSTRALRAAPAEDVARWIHAAVRALPARIDAAVSELEELRTRNGIGVFDRVHGYPPDTGLLVTNLSRIPLEPLDFGEGPPDTFEIAPLPPRARCCFVLPGSELPRLVVARRC